MGEGRLWLREAESVADLIEREKIVRRIRALREEVAIDKASVEHWNRTHPEEEPISTDFEDRVIAWCDGEGPLPEEFKP